MIKLLILLLSFSCLAQEMNECGQTKEEWYADNVRCFEIRDNKVVESHFTTDSSTPKISFSPLTVEELETEYEKVD